MINNNGASEMKSNVPEVNDADVALLIKWVDMQHGKELLKLRDMGHALLDVCNVAAEVVGARNRRVKVLRDLLARSEALEALSTAAGGTTTPTDIGQAVGISKSSESPAAYLQRQGVAAWSKSPVGRTMYRKWSNGKMATAPNGRLFDQWGGVVSAATRSTTTEEGRRQCDAALALWLRKSKDAANEEG